MRSLRFPAKVGFGRFLGGIPVFCATAIIGMAQTNFYELRPFGFPALMSWQPQAPVILASDGVLYGAALGGPTGGGTLFAVRTNGSDYRVLHAFSDSEGAADFSALMEGSDGRLYGVTERGGANGEGTVYRLRRDGAGFQVLRSFGGVAGDARMPAGRLFEGSDGWLYGTSSGGGAEDVGSIYRLRLDGTGYALLHSCAYSKGEGAVLRMGLVEGSDGLLYGVAGYGGGAGVGTLFRLAKDGTAYETLVTLTETLGAYPAGELVAGPGGWLYGTASGGGTNWAGTLFRYHPGGVGFEVVHEFSAEVDSGRSPWGPLVVVGSTLYGASKEGGANNKGAVFQVRTDGTGSGIIHSFTSPYVDGTQPKGLCVGQDGALYGTTPDGGAVRAGSVFCIGPESSGHRVVHSFLLAGGDGRRPEGPLIQGTDGALYGTTEAGGSAELGTVFALERDGTGYRLLHDFTGLAENGGYPRGPLVETDGGELFGTAALGGTGGVGVLFQLGQDGSGFSVVRSFDQATDGAYPSGGLSRGSDGFIYGMAPSGGAGGKGTIYALNPATAAFVVLHSLASSGVEGAAPRGAVLVGEDGWLYGTASEGGASKQGAIFKLRTDGSGFEVMRSFAGTGGDGAVPAAGLVDGGNGFLYGTTRVGGSYNLGTVFRIKRDATGYTVLHHFRSGAANGQDAWSSLALGPEGALYGTTAAGGAGNAGTVYRLELDGTGFKLLHSFPSDGRDGYAPKVGLCITGGGLVYGVAGGGHYGTGNVFLLSPYQPSAGAGAELGADGSVTVGFRASPSAAYSIEGSGDLVSWVILGTATADAEGNVTFRDDAGDRPSLRFYRTRLVLPE